MGHTFVTSTESNEFFNPSPHCPFAKMDNKTIVQKQQNTQTCKKFQDSPQPPSFLDLMNICFPNNSSISFIIQKVSTTMNPIEFTILSKVTVLSRFCDNQSFINHINYSESQQCKDPQFKSFYCFVQEAFSESLSEINHAV